MLNSRRRIATRLAQGLAEHESRGEGDVERPQPRLHRHPQSRIGKAVHIVRHAGVTMSLYQLAAATGDLSVLPTADRGMQYMIDNLYRHADWVAFVVEPGPVQLGASALMLDGLMQRRLATGETRYDDLSRQVARGLLALQQPDGSFLNFWDVAPVGRPRVIAPQIRPWERLLPFLPVS